MCINTREYIRDENNLNYHLITVTSYELLETIMKVDIPNDGGYNMCKAIEDIKNDGKLEGKREGLREGEIKTLYELTRDGIITKETAANKLNITVEKFEKDMKAYFAK